MADHEAGAVALTPGDTDREVGKLLLAEVAAARGDIEPGATLVIVPVAGLLILVEVWRVLDTLASIHPWLAGAVAIDDQHRLGA